MTKKFNKEYQPIYFLSSLGNGGLAVSFFMYLMFMIKHPDTPIPTFNHLYNFFNEPFSYLTVIITIALLGIVFFTFRHLQLLVKNIVSYINFKKSGKLEKIKGTNSEVTLMSIPLTLGMTINVLFIIGAVFVPGLWNIVEMLFPFALLAYGLIGIYALYLFSGYFTNIMVKSSFSFEKNNNFSQLLISFAFAMVAVGFGASAAMSHVKLVSLIGLIGSLIFAAFSVITMIILLVLGIKSIFKNGISTEGTPTVWIFIPIMTLLGITSVRVISGISHNFLETNPNPIVIIVALSSLISIQILSGLLGYKLLKTTGYFKNYVKGKDKSPGSYSLICPGVAAFVLGMFFLEWAFVKTGVITKFSPIYFIIILPLLFIQIKTILTLYRVNKKHLVKS